MSPSCLISTAGLEAAATAIFLSMTLTPAGDDRGPPAPVTPPVGQLGQGTVCLGFPESTLKGGQVVQVVGVREEGQQGCVPPQEPAPSHTPPDESAGPSSFHSPVPRAVFPFPSPSRHPQHGSVHLSFGPWSTLLEPFCWGALTRATVCSPLPRQASPLVSW